MAFWDTSKFKALQRTWYRKAADSGFKDLETPDGEWAHRDSTTNIRREDIELAGATWSRAHDALLDDSLWKRGLTKRHRLFWSLILQGVSVEMAGSMVHKVKGGGGRRKSHEWHDAILGRLK